MRRIPLFDERLEQSAGNKAFRRALVIVSGLFVENGAECAGEAQIDSETKWSNVSSSCGAGIATRSRALS